ncbi:MAG: carboxypeptidase regulatory-like domain-containing protein, partial [Gammaproteobacteria bacterium]|nr:carboxypeptidase regulatory-like domain-containing protein [Gammaproteobacteria bacterium]
YSNGELINNVRIGVQNVSGSRTFTDPSMGDPFSSYSNNSIELSGRNLFSQNEALQLNAKGEYELFDGMLDFNLNGYYYTQGNTRPQVTNTYIDFKKNNKGIRIGNISESLEKYVNGRGVKTYFEDREKGAYFEVGWADKTYNLLGDQYRADSGGYTAYVKTMLSTRKEGEYEGSILYDQTPYENSESVVAMNEYNFEVMKDVRVGFELGAGVTRLLKADESPIEPSVAMGFKLSGKFGKYNINSSNFLSTGYYPGVRRGVVQLNQRISRPVGKVGMWVGYSLYRYNPSQLEERNSFYSHSRGNSRFELGTNFSFARNTRMSITAKQQTDEGVIGYSNQADQETSKMHSLGLTESINWRSRNGEHSVGLSAENGFTKIPFVDGEQFQLRVNANWNYRIFTLNSYYQQGDFTIYEAYRNALNKEDNYRFNVSGGVRKEFFGKRLKTDLNVNYNRDSYSGSNWTYSGRVDYALTPQFSCFVNAYAYSYSSSSYSSFNTNVQAGVRYNLPTTRQASVGKKGDMKLFLYYDNNVNGVYDEGDTPAEGRIVSIGGVSFISNRKGEVVYKKVPYNDYALKIPSQDWYAVAPASITIGERRTTLEIPLQRTGKVTGKLFYKYDARMSEEFAEKYGGLRMWATATDGRKIEALTNANGEFTLFLPVGEYEISVDANSLTKNVYTDFEPQTVKVVADETTEIPAIELKIQQRK